MVARGFPRCKANWIPDKMLENKISENGKPKKMPDNLNRTLTLTGSGPFMSLFTLSLSLSLTHTHTHSLSLSLLINTHSISKSLSLSLTPSLYRHTLPLSLLQKTLLPSHCTHFPSLSLSLCTLSPLSLSKHTRSLSLPLQALSISLHTSSISKHTPSLSLHTLSISLCVSLSLSKHTHYL